MEVCEVVLYGEPTTGLGIGLESTVPPTCTLQDPPIVTRLEPNTAAERYMNHWKIHLYRRILPVKTEMCVGVLKKEA